MVIRSVLSRCWFRWFMMLVLSLLATVRVRCLHFCNMWMVLNCSECCGLFAILALVTDGWLFCLLA